MRRKRIRPLVGPAEKANSLLDKKPVIIFVGNSPEGVHLVKNLSASNQNIPIVSHWGITGGRFWEQTKKHLEKLSLSHLATKTDYNHENHLKFIEQYNNVFD